MNSSKQHDIAIVSFCIDDWGGSEELWARSIPMLNQNSAITLYKSRINTTHPEFIKLAEQNVKLVELEPALSLSAKVWRKARYVLEKVGLTAFRYNHSLYKFHHKIKSSKPDLVIIAQGINFDGLAYAHQCHLLQIPYAVVAQKAVEFYWPYPTDRTYMKETLLHAKKCYFVSRHNKQLTEEQFGIRLPNSEVVFNPVKTKSQLLPFPETGQGFQLACVARLFIIDKGQDMLLRILSKEVWRSRPVTVSFVGTGHDEQGIKDLASLLSIKNIKFIGFQQNITQLWAEHHALILPSRSEGLPLSMVEAMSLGRTVIVSNAGGNAEMISDGVNGFIGDATENDFENAMERAWQMREKWPEIGKNAHAYIQKHLPVSPEKEFANSIKSLLT